jgi:hypothetical protein
MKLAIAFVSLVAALALVNAAEATANKTTNITATLVGTGCGVTGLECGTAGGGSCVCEVTFWQFAGRTNISPPLGSLAFRGEYSDGFRCSDIGDNFDCLVPLTYFRSLTVTLTAPSGDKLVLGENFSSETPPLLFTLGDNPVPGAWTVDPAGSSGRFTRYTGSGTYTLGVDNSPNTYANFTLVLAGSLTFK